MGLHGFFIKHISCPIVFRRDGLKDFFRRLKELERSQYLGQGQIHELQFDRVKRILSHAYLTTEFYRKRFDECGLDPHRIEDLNHLKRIPLLSKQDIRNNLKHLISKTFRKSELHMAETGGTTGVKMRFYRDNSCLTPKEAALFRFDKWTGWDFGERMGIVWTAQQDYVGHWTLKSKIKNALTLRQIVFPAAVMDEEAISKYIQLLQRKKPTMIRAFVSPIYEIAKYILDNGIEVPKLKGIVTTGEPLYRHQRQTILRAFKCTVLDSYRTREVGPIAQECKTGAGMHINAESVFIEIIDQDHAGIGKVVVTDLLNYGMPLIRYEIGDLARFSTKLCSCGRGLPLMESVAGRVADSLYTPEGKLVTAGSLVLYLVDEAPGLLGQVQIIQDGIDHIIIKLTKNPKPSRQILEYQRSTVKRLFGDKMKVTFEFVDEIPLEESGKYRFTVCNLEGPR